MRPKRQPPSPAAPPFEPVDDVLARIDEQAFAELTRFAAERGPELDWGLTLEPLELAPAQLSAAIAAAGRPPSSEHAIFGAFGGSWVGGDLHDSRRAYRHIWYPTEREGRWSVQPVLMLPFAADGSPTVAYDLHDADDPIPVRGVVDGRPYVGYPLPHDAMLWFGAEQGDNVSVHVEIVIADGQLYEICGQVLRRADAVEIARSDWRYHRVDDGAVQARDPEAG
jgi:hypothetical protein